jgi:hypothetical protein
MISLLDTILEEDMQLQDIIEGMNDGMFDDSEDIIIGVLESRDPRKTHLFTEASDEENALNVDIDELLDDDEADDLDGIDIDELIDDDDF